MTRGISAMRQIRCFSRAEFYSSPQAEGTLERSPLAPRIAEHKGGLGRRYHVPEKAAAEEAKTCSWLHGWHYCPLDARAAPPGV